jgi:hypothetical protein
MATPKSAAVLFREFADAGYFQNVATAVGGAQVFNDMYLPMAEQVAVRLQEAPFSRTAFEGRGGSLQCALRAGLLALRLCDKTIFSPTATAAERMTGDREYRWLSFCATLATVYLITVATIEFTLSDSTVFNPSDDESLVKKCTFYELRWRIHTTPLLGKLHIYLHSFFFSGQFAHLSHEKIQELGAAINPTLEAPSAESPLAQVVRRAIERVLADEMATRSHHVSQSHVIRGVSEADDSPETAPTTAAIPATARIVASNHSARPESEDSIPPERIKALEWLRAIAVMPQFDTEIATLPDGRVEFSRKALSFGKPASDTYRMLHGAGAADVKTEKTAILKIEFGQIYTEIRAKRTQAGVAQ